MNKDINREKIKAAIREAVDERKAKTWFDFHGIPYEDMYAFLGEEFVTIKRTEYDHLQQCREKLIQLYEAQIRTLRTDIAQSAMGNAVSQQLTNCMKI